MGRRPRSEGTLVSVAASSAFLARKFRVRCAIRANASTQSGSARLVQGPGTLRSAPALRPVTRSAIGVCQPEMITNRPSAERGLGLIRRHSAQRSRPDQRGRDGGEPLSGETRGLGEAATQAQDRAFAGLKLLGGGWPATRRPRARIFRRRLFAPEWVAVRSRTRNSSRSGNRNVGMPRPASTRPSHRTCGLICTGS